MHLHIKQLLREKRYVFYARIYKCNSFVFLQYFNNYFLVLINVLPFYLSFILEHEKVRLVKILFFIIVSILRIFFISTNYYSSSFVFVRVSASLALR